MVAQTEVSILLEDYLRAYSGNRALVPLSGVPLTPLLSKGGVGLHSFGLDFLGEVLLLARGPLALIVRDKGLLAATGPLGNFSNVRETLTGKLLIRALKKAYNLPLNLVKRAYKGIPHSK